MVRGSVPMRVRRRQSDAKWRASVATCYDTLKRIIPNNEKMSKRKISKALILQETEKHINNLEVKLKELLEQKAQSKGKAVLYQTELGLVEANMEDIRQDFTMRQHNLYLQNCSQRKRSNIPSDMESGLISLRSAVCNLSVIPSECLQQVLPTSQASSRKIRQAFMAHPGPNNEVDDPQADPCEINAQSLFSSDQDIEVKTLCLSKSREDVQFVPSVDKLLRTPVKSKRPPKSKRQRAECRFGLGVHEYVNNRFINDTTPSKLDDEDNIVIQTRTSTRTPSKVSRKLPFVTKSGFTPVKLPSSDDLPDQGVPVSPYSVSAYNMQRDGIEKVTKELNMEDLLCTESIEYMDLENDDDSNDVAKENQRTPTFQRTRLRHRSTVQEKHKRSRSASFTECKRHGAQHKEAECRRQLEKSFRDQKVVGEDVPIISGILNQNDSGCLDFDGYFLFYQHMAKGTVSELTAVEPVIGHQTSQMWKEMPDDARETYVAMAAVENSQSDSSSNLSDDLIDLELKPLIQHSDCGHGSCETSKLGINAEGMEKSSFSIETDHPNEYILDVQLVPCEVQENDSNHKLDLQAPNQHGFLSYQDNGILKVIEASDVTLEPPVGDWQSQIVPEVECISTEPGYEVLQHYYTLS